MKGRLVTPEGNPYISSDRWNIQDRPHTNMVDMGMTLATNNYQYTEMEEGQKDPEIVTVPPNHCVDRPEVNPTIRELIYDIFIHVQPRKWI